MTKYIKTEDEDFYYFVYDGITYVNIKHIEKYKKYIEINKSQVRLGS